MVLAKTLIKQDANEILIDVIYYVTKHPITIHLHEPEGTNDDQILSTKFLSRPTRLRSRLIWPFRIKQLGRLRFIHLAYRPLQTTGNSVLRSSKQKQSIRFHTTSKRQNHFV